jgi:hypothetical protein
VNTLEPTPAERMADHISKAGLPNPNSGWNTVDIDVMSTAAAHVRNGWGEDGYSIAVACGDWNWTLFRGVCRIDGGDFWFVVDRYCNVADIPQEVRL